MGIVLDQPRVGDLATVLAVHREWCDDGTPMLLHPGDIGWKWRFGAVATASALRTWSRDGLVLAIGFLDSATVLRLAISPVALRDEELAARVLADLIDPAGGVLAGEDAASVEVTPAALVHELLAGVGWMPGEPWTPLRRDLGAAVPDCRLRVDVVGPEEVPARVAVQRAAFPNSTFTEERWHAMAAGSPYAQARCLLGWDEADRAVAAVTVWSAGAGKPGLLEPLGVHRDHRGHGHGTAISLAAARALRDMGSSAALVCTPSANLAAVATYESAGFSKLGEARDLTRSVNGTNKP